LQIAAIIRDISERKLRETRQQWLAEISEILGQSLDPKSLMASVADYSLGKFADLSCVVTGDDGYFVVGKNCDPYCHLWQHDGRPVTTAVFDLVKDRRPMRLYHVSQDHLRLIPLSEKQKHA